MLIPWLAYEVAAAIHARAGTRFAAADLLRRQIIQTIPMTWPGDGGTGVLSRSGTLEIPYAFSLLRSVTGADISAAGDRMVVRCYGGMLERRVTAADALSALLSPSDWISLPAAALLQPEAVCYTSDGRAVVTGSEGANTPLLRFPALQP